VRLPTFLPALPSSESLPGASASIILLDPQTGQVLAALGDLHQGVQSATLESHSAGTIITPFIYLTGFSRGLNPASLSWDIPGTTPVAGQVYHGPVRLRTAMANDYLPPAINLLKQMGQESVQSIAAPLGCISRRLEIFAGGFQCFAAQPGGGIWHPGE